MHFNSLLGNHFLDRHEYEELDDELQSVTPFETDELKRYIALKVDLMRKSIGILENTSATISSFIEISYRQIHLILAAAAAAVQRCWSRYQ